MGVNQISLKQVTSFNLKVSSKFKALWWDQAGTAILIGQVNQVTIQVTEKSGFWNLKATPPPIHTSTSTVERLNKYKLGKAADPCTKVYLAGEQSNLITLGQTIYSTIIHVKKEKMALENSRTTGHE